MILFTLLKNEFILLLKEKYSTILTIITSIIFFVIFYFFIKTKGIQYDIMLNKDASLNSKLFLASILIWTSLTILIDYAIFGIQKKQLNGTLLNIINSEATIFDIVLSFSVVPIFFYIFEIVFLFFLYIVGYYSLYQICVITLFILASIIISCFFAIIIGYNRIVNCNGFASKIVVPLQTILLFISNIFFSLDNIHILKQISIFNPIKIFINYLQVSLYIHKSISEIMLNILVICLVSIFLVFKTIKYLHISKNISLIKR